MSRQNHTETDGGLRMSWGISTAIISLIPIGVEVEMSQICAIVQHYRPELTDRQIKAAVNEMKQSGRVTTRIPKGLHAVAYTLTGPDSA